MRKLTACFLFVFYVLVSTASALNLHYCEGGWMTGFNMTQLAAHHDRCPGCHQRQMDKNCCKHPKLQVKINHNQLLSETYAFQGLPFVFISDFSQVSIPQDRAAEGSPLFHTAHAPPRWFATANSRQAFYGVFLI
ncbi:MAG: hypothetical protein JST50_06635 [Bacteroidetes bacterium]|jgi:hypothetical protein|nr:hypothetical protein [Bacteroidota bacterium]